MLFKFAKKMMILVEKMKKTCGEGRDDFLLPFSSLWPNCLSFGNELLCCHEFKLNLLDIGKCIGDL